MSSYSSYGTGTTTEQMTRPLNIINLKIKYKMHIALPFEKLSALCPCCLPGSLDCHCHVEGEGEGCRTRYRIKIIIICMYNYTCTVYQSLADRIIYTNSKIQLDNLSVPISPFSTSTDRLFQDIQESLLFLSK